MQPKRWNSSLLYQSIPPTNQVQTPLLKGGYAQLQIAFPFTPTPIHYKREVRTSCYSVKWTVFFCPKSTCTIQTSLDNADASMSQKYLYYTNFTG